MTTSSRARKILSLIVDNTREDNIIITSENETGDYNLIEDLNKSNNGSDHEVSNLPPRSYGDPNNFINTVHLF